MRQPGRVPFIVPPTATKSGFYRNPLIGLCGEKPLLLWSILSDWSFSDIHFPTPTSS